MNRPIFGRLTSLRFTLAAATVLASASAPAFAQERVSRLPAELYAACTAKSAGTACTAAVHGRELHGICSSDRREPELACRPAPPRPRG